MSKIRILSGRFEVGKPEQAVLIEATKTLIINSPDKLMTALKDACTEYMGYSSGERLRSYAGDDCNIGDLASELGDATLARVLQQHGLRDLAIIDFDDIRYYDERLSNGLEDEDDEDDDL